MIFTRFSFILFLILPLLRCSLPLPSSSPQMDFTCFSTSDPDAQRADKLYIETEQIDDLWMGDGNRLPSCTSASPPPPSKCVACVDDAHSTAVLAVCSNLKETDLLMMEAAGRSVSITQTECPKLGDPDKGAISSGNQDAVQWCLLLPVLIITYLMT